MDHVGNVVGRCRIKFRLFDTESLLNPRKRRFLKGSVNSLRVHFFATLPRIVLSSTSVMFIACIDRVAKKRSVRRKQILKDVSAEIADVGKIIDRRPAGIHADRIVVANDLFDLRAIRY